MKYLYIDRERLARGEPCVAVLDKAGNVEFVDEAWIVYGRIRAPHGQPLTPDGPAAWVEARILTVGHVRCLIALGTLALWAAIIWALVHWSARAL